MASLPSQASRRQSVAAPDGSTGSQSQDDAHSANVASADASEERFLNNPQRAAPVSPSSATHAVPEPAPEPRTCWICQQDDTDDMPENAVWRNPCPCSLTAHDSCLLEWIANEEASKAGEMGHRRIRCPQCRAEIKIARPMDLLVGVADRVYGFGRQMILPTVFSGVVGCLYSGFFVYGVNTIYTIFGADEAAALLKSYMSTGTASNRYTRPLTDALSLITQTMDPFIPLPGAERRNPMIFLGIPTIPFVVIILRVGLKNPLWPLLLSPNIIHRLNSGQAPRWPPTAPDAFLALPFLRTAYTQLYKYAFGALEHKWDLAVQRTPREGETAEGIAAAAARAEEEGDAILEIEFAIQDDGQEMNEPQEPARVPIEEPIDPQVENELGALRNDVHDLRAAVEALPPGEERNPAQGIARNNLAWDFNADVSIVQVASTVMGALAFPAISSLMGTLLKLTLPTRWTTSSISRKPWDPALLSRGLLKEKWSRTIVGGCIFVVLKDVVTLYCKWKKARDFGKRSVLDYIGQG